MDDAELRRREDASLAAFYRGIGARAPGGRAFEADGVVAAIVPGLPERSVFNSVTYRDRSALRAALPELVRAYDDAGVRAWTVWVRDSDRDTADLLRADGHMLDGVPRSMGAGLEAFDSGAEGIEWEESTDALAMAEIARVGFGMPDAAENVAPVLDGWGDEARFHLGRVDGEAVGTTMTILNEGDCGVFMVATTPEARGRGIATGLMRQALHESRQRGCTTTTLQASKMGAPVYARMGYRDLGFWEMWERRTAV